MSERSEKQLSALRAVIAQHPGIENERVRVNGSGGIAEMLRAQGIAVSARVIRRHLRRLKIATSGKGGVAGALISRERLDKKLREVVALHPEWEQRGIRVRGKHGLKAALAADGVRVNHEVIRRRMLHLGLKTQKRGAS